MKVFTVYYTDIVNEYEGSRVIGVYSTEEKAKEAVYKRGADYYDHYHYEIEEWEVN